MNAILGTKWYSAVHKWITYHYGAPAFCENCDIPAKRYHWANLSGEYLRDISDWARLCVRCHVLIDGIGYSAARTRRRNRGRREDGTADCRFCGTRFTQTDSTNYYCTKPCASKDIVQRIPRGEHGTFLKVGA